MQDSQTENMPCHKNFTDAINGKKLSKTKEHAAAASGRAIGCRVLNVALNV
jgi:hypothetical protein